MLNNRGICLSLALLLSVFSLPSQAQQSAALIGIAKYFRPDDPIRPDRVQLGIQYSTVLIVRDGLKATVKITIPDIIVRHGRQWWRVGVRFDCRVQPNEDNLHNTNAYEQWLEQSYSTPIEEAPRVPAAYDESGAPCPAQLFDDFRTAKDSRGPGIGPPSSEPFEPCLYNSVVITRVTSNFVSTREHGGNSQDCETRGFSWSDRASVLSIEDSRPVSYGDLLGQKGSEEYERVLIESGKELESSGFNCGLSEEQFNTANRWASDGTGWFLSRNKGKWEAVALLQPYAPCQYGGSLSLRLPGELVGHDALRPGWVSLQRQIAGWQDAFTSPMGDLIVGVANSHIDIYSLEGQRVGRWLLGLPADRVVMVQWATGKYAGKWAEELQKWQQRGLSPSIISKPHD